MELQLLSLLILLQLVELNNLRDVLIAVAVVLFPDLVLPKG